MHRKKENQKEESIIYLQILTGLNTSAMFTHLKKAMGCIVDRDV